MDTPLTLLYTANLRGDLELLPRLHTFIRNIKAQPVADEDTVLVCALEPVPRRFLLLDLGGACAADVWHCEATEGRSALIVLDAMGYHAADVRGYLSDAGRDKLAANLLYMALVDDAHPWHDDGLALTTGAAPPASSTLHIILTPAAHTQLTGRTLHLAGLEAGQVGIVHIASADGNGALTITGQAVVAMPHNTLPDPTITATVDFVLGEARLLNRRRP